MHTKVSHSKIEFLLNIRLKYRYRYRSTQLPVLRGGKLHPSNAAVLKLLALLAYSASKVPCQCVVIERNGSYRLIRASITDDLGSSRGIIFPRGYLHSVAASVNFKQTPPSLRVTPLFGTPRVDQGRMEGPILQELCDVQVKISARLRMHI